MADWAATSPDNVTAYLSVLALLRARDEDVATMFLSVPTNPITGMIRYNRSTDLFEEYDGATWIAQTIAVAGGGTGASTASGARTNLGIGTMGTQSNSAVNITGGTIASTTIGSTNQISATALTSGTVPDARFPATLPALSGVNLTALNASNLASGTVPDARFPSTLPALSGVNLTNLVASSIATGNLAVARLPVSGTWSLSATLTVSGGSIVIGAATGGAQGAGTLNAEGLFVNGAAVGLSTIPAGTIVLRKSACPAGWTRLSELDDHFPMGAAAYSGTSLGSGTVSGNTNNGGNDDTDNATIPILTDDFTSGGGMIRNTVDGSGTHHHTQPNHLHAVSIAHLPPHKKYVYCEKD